jgi:drug/metabolite transporter (DMT)-like permease
MSDHAISRTMGLADWLRLVLLSVLWGGSFFFVGVVVDDLPPLTIVVLRVGLAAIALNIAIRVLGLRMPGDLRTWAAFFVMGLINNLLPFSLIVWSQGHIASGLASILNAATPLFTVVVAHLLTRDEKMTAGRLAGVLIGLGGVVLITGPAVLEGLGLQLGAQLAVLAATLSYAFAGVYGRRFARQGLAPLCVASGQVTASAVLLLPLALVVETPWTLPLPGLAAWGAVLGLALLSTAWAYALYFRILASAGATNLLLVTLLVPVSAILLGAALRRISSAWR